MKLSFRRKSQIPRRRTATRDIEAEPVSDDVFKRNRTISGLSGGTKADIHSSRKHVRTLSIRRRKVFSTLVVVFLSMLLIWTLISNFTANPKVVVSDLNIIRQVNKALYEKAIQDYLNANPTNRFSFFLDNKAFNQYVLAELPEVRSVSQGNMASIGSINFTVLLRKPVAGWKINGKQYYVDSSGIQFETNYFAAPSVQIIDQSGISDKTSLATTAIASKRFLSFVGQIVSKAKEYGYTVTEAILPANMTRELEIKISESKSRIKLSIDRPAGEQVEDMDNAIKYFTARNKAPSYIDVRVSGKAYYK